MIDIIKKTSATSTTLLAGRSIEYIVIHYSAATHSEAGTAVSLAAWFAQGSNPKNPTSSDYIVDDGTVVQYNPDIKNRYTWGAGGGKYAVMSTSLGGRFYGKCNNKNCINIEIVSNKKDRKSLDANDNDWYFTDSELAQAAELVQLLMAEYNIDSEHVIMHHEVTGKLCPAMWTHSEAELQGWYDFKKRLAPTVSTAKYFVQVGAFSSKANAEKYLAEVKKIYPNAFIKEF